MSVFSILKRGRKTTEPDKLSDKQVGKQKEERPATKYWHVPTHAAADALLGAPAGWMRDDAARIRESNRKRIAKAASQTDQLQHSSSISILSPLHINVHASSYGYGSSSSRRDSDSRDMHWARSRNSRSKRILSSDPIGPTMHISPSFSSLDAELCRARAAASENSTLFLSRPAPPLSMPPSSSSSSPASSPASSASSSPTTCSTASFAPYRSDKDKGDDYDYFVGIHEEYGLSDVEAFELRVLPSSASNAQNFGNTSSYGSNNYVNMRGQRSIPLAATQGQPHYHQQQQQNPYAHPAKTEDSPAPILQVPPQPAISRSPAERTLVPATIASRRPAPISPAVATATHQDAIAASDQAEGTTGTDAVIFSTAPPAAPSPGAAAYDKANVKAARDNVALQALVVASMGGPHQSQGDDAQETHPIVEIDPGAAEEHAPVLSSKEAGWPLHTRTHPSAGAV